MKTRLLISALLGSLFAVTAAHADNLVNLNLNSASGSPYGYLAPGITMSGNAQISSAETYQGSNSLYFDGLSQMTLSGSPLNLGNSDFNISFDVMASASQNPWSYILFSQAPNGPALGNGWSQTGAAGGLIYLWSQPGAAAVMGPNINNGQWTQVPDYSCNVGGDLSQA